MCYFNLKKATFMTANTVILKYFTTTRNRLANTSSAYQKS